MPNLQKIIEENEKDYREWLTRNISPYIPEDRRTTIVESAISALDATQLRLIEGFREMVREKHRKLLGSVEENDIWRSGYNRAIDDLLSELGSINEIK